MKDSNNSSNKTSRINFKIFNNGHPKTLLLLHGFLGSSKIWEPMLNDFQAKFNVVTLDFPGHGDSPCRSEILMMSDMADLINELLTELQIEQVHITGHSMGGYVALELLNKYPDKVLSLTLLNSTAKSDTPEKQKDRLRAVKVFDLSPKIYIREALNNLFYESNLSRISSEVERLQQIALNTSPEGAKACLRGMRVRENYVNLVNESPTPIQYISGVHDTTVTYDSILDQIQSDEIKLTTLKNSGHMSFAEEQRKCTDAVINFALQS